LLKGRTSYQNVFQYQTHAYDVINNRLDVFALMVSSLIQQHGYKAMPVSVAEWIDSERVYASMSHRLTARLAGFGWNRTLIKFKTIDNRTMMESYLQIFRNYTYLNVL
jgi:epoxyqueuosine reductase